MFCRLCRTEQIMKFVHNQNTFRSNSGDGNDITDEILNQYEILRALHYHI